MPDLLLRGFRPIGFGDVAASSVLIDADGLIAALDPPAAEGAEIVDLDGLRLSPGWTDLHTHTWWGGTDISVRPSQAGAATGVATLVDAGSAGEANFHGFRELVMAPARERMFAFLNMGTIGLVAGNRIMELADHRHVNIDRMLACIEANRDLIRGIKIRASVTVLGTWGIAPVKLAKKLGEITKLPLMIHVGEPPPLLEEIFEVIGPGDIVTHCFHGKPAGNLLESDTLFEWARRLRDRGVVLDIGHGAASFSYLVGRAGIERGLLPTTISTDLHVRNIGGPVWDLSMVMSKFLNLGMGLEDILRAVTDAPLRAIRVAPDRLEVGAHARFTAFEIADCNLSLPDSQRRDMTLTRRIMPRRTILGRQVIDAASNYDGARK